MSGKKDKKKIKVNAEGLCLEIKKDAEGNMQKAVFVFIEDGREVRVKVHPMMFSLMRAVMDEASAPFTEDCGDYRIHND